MDIFLFLLGRRLPPILFFFVEKTALMAFSLREVKMGRVYARSRKKGFVSLEIKSPFSDKKDFCNEPTTSTNPSRKSLCHSILPIF